MQNPKITFMLCMALAFCTVACKPKDPVPVSPEDAADLVVYGKIYTADNDKTVEAFAVKDGKYVYVGNKAGAESYILKDKTQILDYTGQGLVMPSCGDGHAHYMMGFAFKTVGTMVSGETSVDDFLKNIMPAAVKRAKDEQADAIFGFGWNYLLFQNNMPTREQLDEICESVGYNVPIYFADEEGHKGLVNTKCLIAAEIMKEDGTVLKNSDSIRGGEIVMKDGKPTGFLKEQAGTYVRSKLNNQKLYTQEIARKNVTDIQNHLLSKGYTMYMDGWSNFFFNDNFYKALKDVDSDPDNSLKLVVGLSHEIESWADVDKEMKNAKELSSYTSRHILPRWIKLFIDGTVESGTGYVKPLYPATLENPEPHQGIINWNEEEVTDITREANGAGLSMHIHTMGNMAVNLCVNSFSNGGKDEMRNTLVHVRNVLNEDWQRMAMHNIYGVSGILWHHMHYLTPIVGWLLGMVPEGMELESYPMASFYKNGVNITSHTDYPALSGSPDDPFGIMEIAVTGVMDDKNEYPWWESELLSREQALQALTINVAKQLFVENERGSITPDKFADFILVDKDVLSCPIKEIHSAKVKATYFEGEKVYSPTQE